jgi:hypothetical protein
MKQGNPARALGAGPSGGFAPDAGASADHHNGLIQKFIPLDGRGANCRAHNSSDRPQIN